jgi:purine-binding chemotaxis protein CheW
MSARESSRQLLEAILSGAAEPEPDDGSRAFLVFEVAGAPLAVVAARVEAVTPAPYVARVPYAPSSVLGVASVRGRMRIVVDAGGARPESGAYLVVLHGDEHLAVLADRVLGVRRLAARDLEGPDAPRVLDPGSLVEPRRG